ncbi:T6SS immunity protein Tli4 family protein [uncultured Pseudacidovorax sp.]|uniref:T6SS immunity protein Tli4 family protein n=1 Tax=uncultured Pseudacidovorax sp. TaxID=679313 RepID=UPI0025D8E85E|nr:T6SS immunity protein Tli4 family protein [uncultured Pseudacidovorax sp.]
MHLLTFFRFAAKALLALTLTACSLISPIPYIPTAMNPLSVETVTHCLGRYLIDLPKGFELYTGGWGDIELYYGLDKDFKTVNASVQPDTYTPEEFISAVRRRRDELNNEVNTAVKTPMLLHTEKIGDYAFLLRRHDSRRYDSSVKSEVHQLVGQRYVIFEQESYVTEKLYAIKPRPTDRYKLIDTAPAEERLKMISSRLRPALDAKRSVSGFCQQGVVFDVGQDDERSNFRFFDESRPDVHIDVHYHAVKGQPKESLFERESVGNDSRIRPMLNAGGYVVMRKREITLGGMNAQELLSRFSRPIVQHLFGIATRMPQRSLGQPTIEITMMTGTTYGVPDEQQTPSSLSDEQARKLWDDMVKSVRPRQPVPLSNAMYCRPGDVCPVDGLWQVAPADHVSSEVKWTYRGQDLGHGHFQVGDLMPRIERGGADRQRDWEWRLS